MTGFSTPGPAPQAADPRTGLAKDRTSFAKFRTQLAPSRPRIWMRLQADFERTYYSAGGRLVVDC